MDTKNRGAVNADTPVSAEWRFEDHQTHLTHLDKIYWPQAGVTKGEMLAYYRQIAPVLLPHLRNRPVTLRMYPDGTDGISYYQRERPSYAPSWLPSIGYRPKTVAHAINLLLIDDVADLIWLVNAGAIEFHTWSSSKLDLALPDEAIFDLDAGDAVNFDTMLSVALYLRDALARQRIASYPKTSGGHGLHVLVPLIRQPEWSFDHVRLWIKAVAERLHSAHAEVAPAHGSTHQGNQVRIDYAQNSIGRNTAAPYTLRATFTHPVVSMPLTWEEVEAGGFHPADFTPTVALDRISRLGDLFSPLLSQPQHLPPFPTGE